MSIRNSLLTLVTAGAVLIGCSTAGGNGREVREPAREASACSCKARHSLDAHEVAADDAQTHHKNLR